MQVTADVKCYYCGHVSGQIIGPKNQPLRVTNFVPRQGFAGEVPKTGERLRCERCRGPVYLEDVSPLTIGQMKVTSLAAYKREKEAKKRRKSTKVA
jgi:DNA-directed RNA polymerase subunit RPC12/RpoP